LDLLLPVHYEGQGGGLHPSHREKLLAQTPGCQRYISGQSGSPDQVYDLPGLSRCGQFIVHASRILEGFNDLVLDDGAVSDPVRFDLGFGLLYNLQGLNPYQLTLAIIVGGYGDPVRLLSQFMQCRYDLLLDGTNHDLCSDQILAVNLLPVIVSLRIVDPNYMAG